MFDRQYAAFLCYPVKADQPPGVAAEGPVSAWRAALEEAVREQSGDDTFEIFMDRRNLKVGEIWTERLAEGLASSSLLIALVQPRLLRSEWCRHELQAFIDAEAANPGVKRGTIIPVYWIETPEVASVRFDAGGRVSASMGVSADALAVELAKRQWFDWRELRFEPLDQPKARKAIAALAKVIVDRLEERQKSGPAAGTVSTKAPQGHTPHAPLTRGVNQRAVFEFLLSAFSRSELERLIRWNYPGVTSDLPGGPTSPAEYTTAAVEALIARGELDGGFFDLLVRERPRRKEEIDRLR